MSENNNKNKSGRSLINKVNVLKANKVNDPLEPFPDLKSYQMKSEVEIFVKRSKQLSQTILNWAFNMVKNNMQKKCEAAKFPFTDQEKMKEMFDKRAWYLVAKLKDTEKYIAFSHFRFDIDFDYSVLYVYEIHVEKEFRRTGLGTFIMKALEKMGSYYSMEKIMLTALKNDESTYFYDKLGFQLDETSIFDDVGYKIISKKLNPEPNHFDFNSS